MSGGLVRTRTVLRRHRGRAYASGGDGDRAHTLSLDADVYKDMGEPETITVTIEPGDKLNT